MALQGSQSGRSTELPLIALGIEEKDTMVQTTVIEPSAENDTQHSDGGIETFAD